MFRVPVDVRKIVLANLECVDYLSALESCKYWYSSLDEKHYEEQKKVYLRVMERRKNQQAFDEAVRNLITTRPIQRIVKQFEAVLEPPEGNN